MTVYKLIWDDFCSWYLEIIKPPYGEAIDTTTYNSAINLFEKLMQLLHPFMPFITEEIWHTLREREEKDCIMMSKTPCVQPYNKEILNKFEAASQVIIAIRTLN